MLAVSILLCFLAFGEQSFDTLTTVTLRRLVNSISVYVPGTTGTSSPLVEATIFFIGCAVAAAGLSAIFVRIEIPIRKRLLEDIESRLFSYALWHAPSYFEQRLPGEIAQQIRNAAQGASGLFVVFTYFGMRFLAMVVSAALVFSTSIPALNLIALLWTLIFLAGSYFITRTCSDLSKQFAAKGARVVGRMVDSLRNVTIVRSFGRQAFEQSHLRRYINEERTSQATLRMQFYRLYVFQLAGKIVLSTLVVGFSLYALLEGRADVGSVVMLIALAGLISSLLQAISDRMYDVFDNFGVVSQALSYLVVRHAIADVPGAGPLLPADASVNFQNVTFRYPSGSFVLENFNLYIKPREKIGIVGISGSGKSTVMRLLKREYEPAIGGILIGNRDISRCTLSSLADAIVEVPQQVRLFNRSIRENIAYGRRDASDAEVCRAAGDVGCLDFIAQRADGIGTEVGEDGVLLSGGERQRISIARAILKNAPILLLDEATSSLDPISEACVQRNLTRLMEGKTVIAIAHRLSTLRQMDRIVVMAAGQIVEQGSHAQLLKHGQYYRRLWEGQSDLLVPAGTGDRT